METLGNKKSRTFFCQCCDYITSKKSDIEKHYLTKKHAKKATFGNKNSLYHNMLRCDYCDDMFASRSGLWKHMKKCEFITQHQNSSQFQIIPQNNDDNTNINNTSQKSNELIDVLVRQQEETSELKKMLVQQQEQMREQQEQHHKQIKELIPHLNQITNINNTTNNKNCNNKFNLNFFLNEQCKDAMSIQNFIQSIDIGIKELEHMGDVGYVNGMMNIFSNTLGAMDVYKRPLHCTDLKRETLYIKHGDTWQKDTEDKSELKKLIKSVERKNYGTLRQWEKQHPDAFECDTPDNIEYMKISTESLGGEQSTDALKLNKIMKHVIREVYVK